MPARRRPAVNRLRRGVRVTLFVAAAASALAAAGPDALVPFRAVAGAAASEVRVAFVIDFGGSAHASVGCVKVPASDNGYQALAAFTAQEHEQAPTYNSSGLLCSINDIPKSGCGQQVSDGYIYWSYWEAAAGKWKYADIGAFGAVTNGEIQGWRFQDPGKANPSDPPPTTLADFASICSSISSPTTTTTTQATSVSTSPTITTTSTDPSPGTAPPVRGQGKSNGSGPTSTSSSGNGASSNAKGAADHSTRTTDPPTKAPESAPGTGGSASSTSTNPSGGSHAQALSATPTDDRSGGGDSAAPLIIGSLFILALLSVAVIRWRRRPGSP
jgi:hypothetical protein